MISTLPSHHPLSFLCRSSFKSSSERTAVTNLATSIDKKSEGYASDLSAAPHVLGSDLGEQMRTIIQFKDVARKLVEIHSALHFFFEILESNWNFCDAASSSARSRISCAQEGPRSKRLLWNISTGYSNRASNLVLKGVSMGRRSYNQ